MSLLESRRLTGPNLLLDREGAVLEVALAPEEAGLVERWAAQARRLLDAVGWAGEEVRWRRFPGGASLAITAPFDALYAATEVNEEAWAAAIAPDPAAVPAEAVVDVVERLRAAIAAESSPALRALREAAEAHGVAFLADDETVSVGLGTGSLAGPASAPPAPCDVPWEQVHDVPVLLVTGTNGKTTTVRLLAAMARAAGRVAGTTSTDRVEVGGEVLALGDYSGPGGARTLLRDRRVEIAILETARGGILRRGLAVRTAEAALVTNVAADHLGEFGIADLGALAEAKLVVASVVRHGGRVVLNAEDPELAARAAGLGRPVTWFALDPGRPEVLAHLAAGGDACLLQDGALVLVRGGRWETVVRVEDVPAAFGGAARHNVANALAAIGLAAAAGLPVAAMAAGLAGLRGTPDDNPGRANLFEIRGVRALVDYAHNPHGLAALLGIADALPARRRLVILGQAGDRDDEAIRELARAAWRGHPDRVVIKEMESMLRGRQPGEVPALLEDELRRLGAPPEAIARAGDDLDAVRRALAWAEPGDLLLLLVHTQRDEVLELLRGLQAAGGER